MTITRPACLRGLGAGGDDDLPESRLASACVRAGVVDVGAVVGAGVIKAPFPWFGGKSRASEMLWAGFGAVDNYVEPFAGSLATLLGRPQPFRGPETVNDADGFVSNFWRAVAHDPEATARWAAWPVNENDLHARHAWLVSQRGEFTAQLEGDPEFYDAKTAGWWVWGICCWIGSGWCSGSGPWVVAGGKLVHAGNAGRGVNRTLVHAGSAGLGEHGIYAWFDALSQRLRRVRVCCGDWSRVTSEAVTTKHGVTAVLLDPPYDTSVSKTGYSVSGAGLSAACREWAIANGHNPKLRIALCGYDGEHAMPEGWRLEHWSQRKGFQVAGDDGSHGGMNERIWFSPHCQSSRPLLDMCEATA